MTHTEPTKAPLRTYETHRSSGAPNGVEVHCELCGESFIGPAVAEYMKEVMIVHDGVDVHEVFDVCQRHTHKAFDIVKLIAEGHGR